MRFAAAFALLSAASLAAAQTTTAAGSSPTGSSSECQAQNIVDACRAGIETQIEKCEGTDWICLCDNYSNLLTCYNNCPDSNERPPVQNQVTQYCNAAAPLSSASLASAKSAMKTAPVVSSTATQASATGSSTATGTGAAASSFNTGAASAIIAPVGGAFAVLLGLAGLL